MMNVTSKDKRKDGEADNAVKRVNYKGMGVSKVFETGKHMPFEVMCGHCYYLGDTAAKESTKKAGCMGILLCCTGVCATSCGNQRKNHRTDHYCGNCGAHLAYSNYGRSDKKAPCCTHTAWMLDADEEDGNLDFNAVKKQKM